ncbi:MAG: hypothetical protein ACE5JR_01140 [Gemmatimonadota bacterium]
MGITISRDGAFELGGRAYRIPKRFSRRDVLSYRTLIRPMQDVPRLKPLTAERQIMTRKYLLWRAAACVIPSFRETDPNSLSQTQLDSLHEWIAKHRPELFAD